MKKFKLITPIILATVATVVTPLTTIVTNNSLLSESDLDAAEYCKFTFEPNGGTMSGKTTFRIMKGKDFSTIPVATPSKEGYNFTGWFDKTTGDQWQAGQPVNADSTAVAGWAPVSSSKTITFVAEGAIKKDESTFIATTDTTITGPTTTKVAKGTTWSQVTRPTAKTTDAKATSLSCWATRSGTSPSYTYTILTDADVINEDTSVYPIFDYYKYTTCEITGGVDEITTTLTDDTAFGVSAKDSKGGTTTIDLNKITWKVYSDSGCTTESDLLTINATTGKATAKYVDATTSVWVKASISDETINGTISSPAKEVKITLPSYNSSNVYAADTANKKWYKITDPCTTETNLKITDINGGTETTSAKSSFNFPIYLGDNLHEIKDNFLNGCTAFNSKITYGTSKVYIIGDFFLQGCSSFNQTLTWPNGVEHIGKSFLDSCTSFNNGDGTNDLILPDSVTTIDSDFLYGCTSFAQNVTVGVNVNDVRGGFMSYLKADKMNGKTITLYMDNPQIVFRPSNTSFTTTDSFGTNNGITLSISDSTNLSEFKTVFPNLSGGAGLYRKWYEAPANFLTCSWSEVNTWCTNLENGTITDAEFCAHFLNGTTAITSLADFVGLERTITINGLNHKVRVVDTKHDELTTQPTGKTGVKATLSFDMVNLLSWGDYGPMGLPWNNIGWSNSRYFTSQFRKNLTGEGNVFDVKWYRKDDADNWTEDTSETRTVFEMLPYELQSGIKTVNKKITTKEVGESDYSVKAYSTTLFPLTYTEMGQSGSSWAKVEGTAYNYWTIHTANADRVKKYFLNSSGETYEWQYWLATPYLQSSYPYDAWQISQDGYALGKSFRPAAGVVGCNPISFGFCI